MIGGVHGRILHVNLSTGQQEEKTGIFDNELNWMHAQDCAVNCHFYPYSYQHLADSLSGVTGLEYGIQELLNLGARAQTLSRLFNLRRELPLKMIGCRKEYVKRSQLVLSVAWKSATKPSLGLRGDSMR